MTHAALLFSGGKDSVLALAALRADPTITAVTLVATVADDDQCITSHRVPRALIEAQAASLCLPIRFVTVSRSCSNAEYAEMTAITLEDLRGLPDVVLATGDLHLVDIRRWREGWAARLGMPIRFPLWGRDPLRLARGFVADGYRSTVVCVDTTRLAATLAGATFDDRFVDALPASLDPCGENGEFHTFVTTGPGFAFDVPAENGIVYHDGNYAYAPQSLGRSEHCTQCGAPFTCVATRPEVACWCVRMPHIAPDPLAAGCLCPRCLAARIDATR